MRTTYPRLLVKEKRRERPILMSDSRGNLVVSFPNELVAYHVSGDTLKKVHVEREEHPVPVLSASGNSIYYMLPTYDRGPDNCIYTTILRIERGAPIEEEEICLPELVATGKVPSKVVELEEGVIAQLACGEICVLYAEGKMVLPYEWCGEVRDLATNHLVSAKGRKVRVYDLESYLLRRWADRKIRIELSPDLEAATLELPSKIEQIKASGNKAALISNSLYLLHLNSLKLIKVAERPKAVDFDGAYLYALFDDELRKYDSKGKLVERWKAEGVKEFTVSKGVIALWDGDELIFYSVNPRIRKFEVRTAFMRTQDLGVLIRSAAIDAEELERRLSLVFDDDDFDFSDFDF